MENNISKEDYRVIVFKRTNAESFLINSDVTFEEMWELFRSLDIYMKERYNTEISDYYEKMIAKQNNLKS